MKLLGVLALVALAATCASAQMYVIEIGVTQDGQEQPLGESQVRKASYLAHYFWTFRRALTMQSACRIYVANIGDSDADDRCQRRRCSSRPCRHPGTAHTLHPQFKHHTIPRPPFRIGWHHGLPALRLYILDDPISTRHAPRRPMPLFLASRPSFVQALDSTQDSSLSQQSSQVSPAHPYRPWRAPLHRFLRAGMLHA
jgi:hypothetical protein